MTISRRSMISGSVAACAAAGFETSLRAEWDRPIESLVDGGEDFWTASDAYVWGYPLVTMEMTRRVMTIVAAPEARRAPMGTLIKLREYPDPSFRDVTAPNADTLYTTAMMDVGKEPMILSVPDMKGRYFLLPLLDAWTHVFQSPGMRTTGTGAQTYAITGPGWTGSLPAGVFEYKSATSLVWLLGRIYCTGTPEDYAAVHALQDEFKLVPLSSYGKPYTPPPGKVDPSVDMKTAVRDQVNRMDAQAYFSLLAHLLETNPPMADDGPIVARIAKIGLVPGQDFDGAKMGADFVKRIPQVSVDRIMLHFKDSKDISNLNGWAFATKTGVYGTDYLQRALVAAIGLGANLPQDAVYPASDKDAKGRPYDGAKKYALHFEKGQMPPVKGFWSVTMYDKDYFFTANSLNRYSISPRQNLKSNPDGSVDIYFQHESPGAEKESNWLPAPASQFQLMMRLYWPNETPPSIIDGSWKPPQVLEQS